MTRVDCRVPRSESPAVSFKGVTKVFGSFAAVRDVSFDVGRGEFHALLGENGAGKTTLMRVLAGELRLDGGAIAVDGSLRRFRSPRHARESGIRLVHQHSMLIPNFTVVENFALDSARLNPVPDLEALASRISSEALEFGIELDPRMQVHELSATQKQWWEVFRAIFGRGKIVALDEPTALLSRQEGDALLHRLRVLTRSGTTIILITHKMREVFRYADVVTVLRKGSHVATRPLEGVDDRALAGMMIEAGEQLEDTAGSSSLRSIGSESLLSFRDVTALDSRGHEVLRGISLDVLRGEVVGVAGISGNGQGALARIAAGLDAPTSGTVLFSGATSGAPSFIPDDRVNVGTAADLAVSENLTLREAVDGSFARGGVLDRSALRALASNRREDYQIKTPSLDSPVRQLSGGNLQRIVVARELAGRSDLVVAHNPTAGLDVATSAFVRRRLVDVAESRGALLLISDDIDELFAVADRVLVLQGGRVAGSLARGSFDAVAVGALMSGARQESAAPTEERT